MRNFRYCPLVFQLLAAALTAVLVCVPLRSLAVEIDALGLAISK